MIPLFDHNGVLPPYLVHPRASSNMAPYRSSTLEICQKWGADTGRRAILRGFLNLRKDLVASGIVNGFQWVDGSFVEDCENTRRVGPGDIDVVTFYRPYAPTTHLTPVLAATLSNRTLTKQSYQVDHILMPLAVPPEELISGARFWYGLFSHRKLDEVWKGMLHVALNTPAEDADSVTQLDAFENP